MSFVIVVLVFFLVMMVWTFLPENLILIGGLTLTAGLIIFPIIAGILETLEKYKQKQIDERLLSERPKDKDLVEYRYWKSHEEPKHASISIRPPDWGIRKKYIAEIYNHKCGLCHKQESMGHVHHVNKLSSGGTNALQNLVYLCRSCHEDQHEHMRHKKHIRKKESKARGITEEEYIKEKRKEHKLRREADIKHFQATHTNQEIREWNERQDSIWISGHRKIYYPLKSASAESEYQREIRNEDYLIENDSDEDELLSAHNPSQNNKKEPMPEKSSYDEELNNIAQEFFTNMKSSEQSSLEEGEDSELAKAAKEIFG